MSTPQVSTQSHIRTSSGQRGKRGNRGRGASGHRGRSSGQHASEPASSAATVGPNRSPKQVSLTDDTKDEQAENLVQAEESPQDPDDSAICFICAEPVKYYSVSQCNHRTCHVCALRLRALYKKMDCTYCKEPQPTVIFTASPEAPWSSYSPESILYKDPKLSIWFETQEIMEESLILLRFNCPDSSCDYIANGWSDLKLHTRATHGRLMCDLCIKFKKTFTHEHVLYAPNQLPFHLPSMYRPHRSAPPKEQIEGGIHPMCEFCRECFFSDDELYPHMRESHEECFVCKRNEVRDMYFRNYEALEQHFTQAHHPCTQPVCLAHKFVVFGSALDLKAHMVEQHGAEMSARDKRDARRVDAAFEFEEVGVGGRRGRRDRGDREREREPPPSLQPPSSTATQGGPPRPAISAGARRREAFGNSLTTDSGPNRAPSPGNSRVQSRRQSPSPPAGDADPVVIERHTAFLLRVSSLAPNPNAAVPAVKAAVRSYRASESAARDLISTVWNVLDRNLEGTASIINALVDLLDEEDKKRDILQAWNGFKVEQRNQFPELVPTGTGTDWAGITGGRVLNAKQSTASRSSSQSSRQVLDRVARAAAASSSFTSPPAVDRFPPLVVSTNSAPPPGYRQSQQRTPWASASIASPAAPVIRGPTSIPGPGAKSKATPVVLSKSAFPELPTSSVTRVPRNAIGGNPSLRKILGESAVTTTAWGKGGSANGSGASTPTEVPGDGEAPAETQPVGKKKGKGKQKQTLFTIGTFPS